MTEKEILQAAAEIADPVRREAYVRGAAAGDEGLRERVEAILGAHFSAWSFLEAPAEGGSSVDPEATTSPVDQALEGAGTLIGPYKLRHRLGEGGMGEVYLAEQERPVKRRVALKIIRAGLDSRQVIARFEQERQVPALSRLPPLHRAGGVIIESRKVKKARFATQSDTSGARRPAAG